MADFEDLAAVRPGDHFYDDIVRRYLGAWKSYWSDSIPEMIATKRVPDGVAWGKYPTLGSSVSSDLLPGWWSKSVATSRRPRKSRI